MNSAGIVLGKGSWGRGRGEGTRRHAMNVARSLLSAAEDLGRRCEHCSGFRAEPWWGFRG